LEEGFLFKQKFQSYKKALSSLIQGINANPVSSLAKEGAIHRFEITWELAWQTLQDLLEYRGIVAVKGPNPVIQEAGKLQIISNLHLWDQMRRDRNRASHTYDEILVEELYNKISTIYLPLFLALETTFENEQ